VTRLVRTLVADADEVNALLRPRNDIVAETPATMLDGSHRFELAEGPFTSYSRLVEVSPASEQRTDRMQSTTADVTNRYEVTETVEWRLAVPWFGPLFNVAVRRAMRTGRTGDGTRSHCRAGLHIGSPASLQGLIGRERPPGAGRAIPNWTC